MFFTASSVSIRPAIAASLHRIGVRMATHFEITWNWQLRRVDLNSEFPFGRFRLCSLPPRKQLLPLSCNCCQIPLCCSCHRQAGAGRKTGKQLLPKQSPSLRDKAGRLHISPVLLSTGSGKDSVSITSAPSSPSGLVSCLCPHIMPCPWGATTPTVPPTR